MYYRYLQLSLMFIMSKSGILNNSLNSIHKNMFLFFIDSHPFKSSTFFSEFSISSYCSYAYPSLLDSSALTGKQIPSFLFIIVCLQGNSRIKFYIYWQGIFNSLYNLTLCQAKATRTTCEDFQQEFHC